MKFKNAPKIELHCHLDGSLRIDTVIDLIKKENLELKNLSYDEIKSELIVPDDCPSLNDYLKRFDIPNMLMQSKENLKRIAYELIEDASLENVKYIEVRFAPLLHKNNGLSVEEIIESVLEGLREGERDFNVKSNLILSLLRHMDVDSVYEVIEGGKKFIGQGVVALDLAGGEEKGFVHKFVDAFKLAREYGYKVTIHAGETGFAENVSDAINLLKAERIGHGVAILNDTDVYKLVKDNNIVLEMCPKSNVQTKAVQEYSEHPIKKFLDDGLCVNLSTDNRTVSNVTLTEECNTIDSIHSLTESDIKKIYINSIKGAFCTNETKEWLMTQI
ncbi:adenosine deaminase [Clostridium baratii str. Sullivan]|uniref:Adenosine deaminase n=1 Tax=Clostridium baratii str. Sullivan TaxID=1415775 RepID=A0A0A7FZK4_9CLOT|nr:adenosine deaminase [Clostridium baratii]AIY84320.1 adenosine deaminase [Clostridium baratii str. Sullivan]